MRIVLKLKSLRPGDFESTFIEIILPGRKNLIVGCIYQHPSSSLTIVQFIDEYIEPLLLQISKENKVCSLLGDFNIDLLKVDSFTPANKFFNTLTSNFFASLKPSRPISKRLIDNIFINSIDYTSTSGNLTIQLADHLFQFVILERFFKELVVRKINLKERNFKHFNEREFVETINTTNWENILQLERNYPNIAIENLHAYVNSLLDEFAPYKKVSKKEFKLKSKTWITKAIQFLMWERDKSFHNYCKEDNVPRRESLYSQFNKLCSKLTQMK